MSAVTLSGVPCTSVRFNVSTYGLWWAEVTTQFSNGVLNALPPGGAVLAMADAVWRGTVAAGGEPDGVGRWHIVGGNGGWGKEVSKLGYHSAAGVNPQLVLADTASKVGEALVFDVPMLPQGTHYTRAKGLASGVLNGLAAENWYIDQAGITHVGKRTTLPLTPAQEARLTRTRVDPASGLIEFAAIDSIVSLRPGTVIPGFGEVRDVEVQYDSNSSSGLRVFCYCATSAPAGRLEAYAKIFDALDPNRRFRASYECRVVAQMGNKFTLQPLRTKYGLPDLTQVPYRPGVGGIKCTVAPGSLVLVSFADGDPTRPYVSGFDSPDSPGWNPVRIDFGSPGVGMGVAYQGAPVLAGPFGGTILLGSTRVGVVP